MTQLDYLHINPTPYVPQYSQLAANYLVWYLINQQKTWKIISTTHDAIEKILRQNKKLDLLDSLQKNITSYKDFESFVCSKRELQELLWNDFNNKNSRLFYDHNHIRYQSKVAIETYEGMKFFLENPEKSIYCDYIQNILIPQILDKNPKVLGTTIADKWQLEFVYCLISLIKQQNIDIKVGLWWYLPSVCMPDLIQSWLLNLLFEYIDFIVHNEWEIPLDKYIDYLDWKWLIEDVPQLLYKKWDRIVTNSLDEKGRIIPAKMASLDPSNIANPHFPDEIKNKLYMPRWWVVWLLMSRWCPYICSFCAIDKWYNRWAIAISVLKNNITISNRKQANQSARIIKIPEENLVDHIHAHYNAGTRIFSIVDESLQPSSIGKIVDKMKLKNLHDCSFEYYATLHKKYLDQDFCDRIWKMWFIFPQFWLETISEKALEKSCKNQNLITLHEQKDILKNCWSAWIMPHIFLMMWLPDQTHSDLSKTVAYLGDIGNNVLTIKPTTTKIAKYSEDSIYPERIGVALKEAKLFSANIPFEYNGFDDEVMRISQKSSNRWKNIFDLWIAIRHKYNFLTKELPYAYRLSLWQNKIVELTEEYYKKYPNINQRSYDWMVFKIWKEKILEDFRHIFIELLKENCTIDNLQIDIIVLIIRGIYLSWWKEERVISELKPLLNWNQKITSSFLEKAWESCCDIENEYIHYDHLLATLEKVWRLIE